MKNQLHYSLHKFTIFNHCSVLSGFMCKECKLKRYNDRRSNRAGLRRGGPEKAESNRRSLHNHFTLIDELSLPGIPTIFKRDSD